MNSNTTQRPLVRLGHRIAAFVSECNYGANRLGSLQNTPERF
jgi:hypothetical protein